MKTQSHAENDHPAQAGQESGQLYSPGGSVVRGDTWDDEELIAALQRRDSGAVAYAVETYAPKLYRFAVYQLGDATAAEDLVSEVITRMLEKIDDLRYTGAPFQAWLFSIARNLVADAYRRKGRAQVFSLDRPLDDDYTSNMMASQGPDDFEARIENMANRETLVRILGNLTPEQRQIVILRVVEGWQPGEIARLLGRSIDSVKSLQYRALQSLRRFWERDTQDEAEPGSNKRRRMEEGND